MLLALGGVAWVRMADVDRLVKMADLRKIELASLAETHQGGGPCLRYGVVGDAAVVTGAARELARIGQTDVDVVYAIASMWVIEHAEQHHPQTEGQEVAPFVPTVIADPRAARLARYNVDRIARALEQKQRRKKKKIFANGAQAEALLDGTEQAELRAVFDAWPLAFVVSARRPVEVQLSRMRR